MDSDITTIIGIEEPVTRQRSFQSMYGAVRRRRRVKVDLVVGFEVGFVVGVVVLLCSDPAGISNRGLSGVSESIFIV